MLSLETAVNAAENGSDVIDVVNGFSTDIATSFHIPRIAITIIVAIVILIVAKILVSIIKHSILDFSKRSKKFSLIMAQLAWKLFSALIWIIAIIAVLGIFGIDLTPVLAGLGITGVVLGFALQESISSLFSGIMIALNSPFRVGDWVDIGDISGTVESMDLMCVTLSSGDNKKITMNNKNVWSSTIVNYSYIDKRRLDLKVSFRYTDDIEKTKAAIRNLLSTYPEVMKDPAPLVEVGEYGASSITMYVRPWVSPSDYWNVYWRFNSDILKALQANGSDMPFNQLVVHLEKG